MKNKKSLIIATTILFAIFITNAVIYTYVERYYSHLDNLRGAILNIEDYALCKIAVYDVAIENVVYYDSVRDKDVVDKLLNEVSNIGAKITEPTSDTENWLQEYAIYFYKDDSFIKYEVTIYDNFAEMRNNINLI